MPGEVPARPPLWWTLTVPPDNPQPPDDPALPGNPQPPGDPALPGNPQPPEHPAPPANEPAPRPAPRPLLTVAGVSRRYGDRAALLTLDLTLSAGQCVPTSAANGSGMSTSPP